MVVGELHAHLDAVRQKIQCSALDVVRVQHGEEYAGLMYAVCDVLSAL